MKKQIILVGGGGHCKSCIDVIEQEGRFEIAGIVDVPAKMGSKVLTYNIIASDDDLDQLVLQFEYFLITIGQIGTPGPRQVIYNHLKNLGAKFPVILSPHAYVSKYASLGEGTIIMHHALINAGAKVGNNCIINSKVLIEHDAIIGDHCHIATGAIINGDVIVGGESFIGSSVITKQGIELPVGSFIKAGSLIKK